MENKQPQVLSIVEVNLEQVKKLNEMIQDELTTGTREDSLVIRHEVSARKIPSRNQ